NEQRHATRETKTKKNSAALPGKRRRTASRRQGIDRFSARRRAAAVAAVHTAPSHHRPHPPHGAVPPPGAVPPHALRTVLCRQREEEEQRCATRETKKNSAHRDIQTQNRQFLQQIIERD
ncbi:hypothetical protein ABZP36_004452, partial [Zizania latifolia]